MDYEQKIKAIRLARKVRDEAADAVYKLKLKQRKGKTEFKKSKEGFLKPDAALTDSAEVIYKEITALTQEHDKAAMQLKALENKAKKEQTAKEELPILKEELGKLIKQAEEIYEEISSGKIAASRSTKMLAELKDLEIRTSKIEMQLERLNSQAVLTKTRNGNADSLIQSKIKEREDLQKQAWEIKFSLDEFPMSLPLTNKLKKELALIDIRINNYRQRITALEEELNQLGITADDETIKRRKAEEVIKRIKGKISAKQDTLRDLFGNADAPGGPTDQEINSRQEELNRKINEWKAADDIARQRIEDLFIIPGLNKKTDIIDLLATWNDAKPIMLLPVRIETKFKENELWVRIFPDDIAVVTHERALTENELNYGKRYWENLFEAGEDANRKTEAWRVISEKFDPNRASWIAMNTKPLNLDIAETKEELLFSDMDGIKASGWTEAPRSHVMPDQFVVMTYRNGQQVHKEVGKVLPDVLVLGPDPLFEDTDLAFTKDTDGKIIYSKETNWLINFEEACEKGLGFKLRDKNISQGYTQLLVLGIKISADYPDGQKLVENLIDNHHYSVDGFSLLQQGMPTNNTQENDSAYSTKDPFQDISYFVETGEPLFTPVDNPAKATDGQRLAEYLGIEYGPLQYIANSNKSDYSEAVAMNQALYAGTLGYFMNSMLNEIVDEAYLPLLRAYFCNYVTGRGPMAPIRVGKQPYGIMATSHFPNWKFTKERVSHIPARKMTFLSMLHGFLVYLDEKWNQLLPGLPQVTTPGKAGANLMNILGLQPSAGEYYQRIGYSFDHLKNLESLVWDQYEEEMYNTFVRGFTFQRVFSEFGYSSTTDEGIRKSLPHLFKIIFQHLPTPLDVNNLIDNLPLSEDRPIQSYDDIPEHNYIYWLLQNLTPDKLEKQDFGGAAKPTALLYLLLHHSLLRETGYGINRVLKKNDIISNQLLRSQVFMNITEQPSVAHWEIFKAPVNQLIPSINSSKSMFEYIHSIEANDLDVSGGITEHKAGLLSLQNLSTARLERLMAEHIDILTYRLDAWQSSLFDYRLRDQRNILNSTTEREMGIYIGAYGYLENLIPAGAQRQKISEDQLPPVLRENKDNLYEERENGGYVHTPSLNHAAAAAILRNGYLTHATPDNPGMLSVNLSSERVRRGKSLIEGIRNGQTIEALLGYQFERGMHDQFTNFGINLNPYLPVLRKAFPIKKSKIPNKGSNEPIETIEDYQVVNGMDIINTPANFPVDVTDLEALSPELHNALRGIKNDLSNTLDAMKDLLTAESAYQLAMGNFDRAAGVLQSISNGKIPPEIEVINTERGTDKSLTNRVFVQFDTSTAATSPWTGIDMTERAIFEPALNKWLAGMLGDPANVRCIAEAVDEDGITLRRVDNSLIRDVVSLADLQLQPIDFIQLIGNMLGSDASPLEARIRYEFVRKHSISDTTFVKITFTDSGSSDLNIFSFEELLPLASQLQQLLAKSRPSHARDFTPGSVLLTTMVQNSNNVEVDDLIRRVNDLYETINGLSGELITAWANAGALRDETSVTYLRKVMKQLADTGYPDSLPQSATGFGEAEILVLGAQTASLIKRLAETIATYNTEILEINHVNTAIEKKVSLLNALTKSILGDTFVPLLKFKFLNVTDISAAFTNKDALLDYAANDLGIPLVKEEWLHGVSLVRPKMHSLEMVRALHDNFQATPLVFEVMQLPYKDDDTWLAVEFPETVQVDHDTLSFVLHLPQSFNPLLSQCGLLIDEWVETIPAKQETTGISFNYNQPDSTPANVILLAVTPEETGKWSWEKLETSVLDTFNRARQRAVDPDMLDTTILAGLLPGVISEFSTSESNISLDFGHNIKYVIDNITAIQHKVI